jgi:exodeoxyribonuclease V alpha subunit
MPVFASQSTAEPDKLSGVVNRITFHSNESGYTVLKVSSYQKPKEEVTVLVHQSKVFAGATLDFYGEWADHPSYGRQFKARRVVERKPATANALEKYLGSGLIKGVGPVTAKKIVRHFGEQTLEVFDAAIERLTEVPGIARAMLDMIRSAWTEHQEIRNVMLFYSPTTSPPSLPLRFTRPTATKPSRLLRPIHTVWQETSTVSAFFRQTK